MNGTRILTLVTVAELAKRINRTPDPATGRVRRITPQAVTKWVKSGRIPADRCIVVEMALDSRVTRYEMRPDVYGPAPESGVA